MNKSKCRVIVLFVVGVLVLLALGASLLGGCGAQTLAFRASDANSLSEEERAQCIPLFLPRTVLEFRCTGVVETTEPSQLWKMATDASKKAGFDVNDVKEEAETLGITLNDDPNTTKIKYSIRDPVLTTRGERDPNELFLIRIKSGRFKRVEFSSQFSPDGVAGSVSSAVEDRTFEFTTKTIETGAAVAGKVMGVRHAPPVPGVKQAEKAEPNLVQAVAARIRTVRAERESLISGIEVPPADERTFVRMLDELAKLEAGLVAYFTGVRTEELFPLTSTIRPVTSADPLFELFRFDEDTGFEANPDTEEVRFSMLPERLRRTDANEGSSQSSGPRTDAAYAVKLALSPAVAETNALKRIHPSQGTARGLPYRIPVRVFAEVRMEPLNQGQVASHGTKSLVKTEILLGQWGQVAYLPPSVGSSGSTFKPIYHTETGALKELTVTGMPLSADSLSSLDRAAGSIADALKAQADREAAAAQEKAARGDELSLLKREGDILEQKVRIRDLQERLPPAGAP